MTRFSYIRLLWIFTLALIWSVSAFAKQKNDKENTFHVAVEGVFDRITEKELFDAGYKLIDSRTDTIIMSGKAKREWNEGGRIVKSSSFRVHEIPREGAYRLIITLPGYEESVTEIDGSELGIKEYVIFLDKIFLDRKAKDLDGITVHATKVKFYHKGDTLVYNADAFVMSEGSMLDDIIRQLPGVELKDNGQILVNGEFVESLLLNGKDFFKGNRQAMLKNLAAYTVKNIEVYERQKDEDKLLGEQFGKKILTMDVKLKKEYNHNYMGNLEAGYGTENRFLGRLFGMWNSDHARISLIGNVNNLNETRKPGMEQAFTPEGLSSGNLKTYMGGLEYNVDNKKSGWQFNGDVVFNRTCLDDVTRIYTKNFISSGDTYGREFRAKINKDLKISTNHTFKSMGKWHYVEIHPSFDYNKSSCSNLITKAVFNTDVQNVTNEMIRNIYDSFYASDLTSLINRQLREQSDNGNELIVKLWTNGRFRLKTKMLQSLSYLVSGNYKRKIYEGFNRFGINFGKIPEFAEVSDRRLKNSPDNFYNIKAAIGYQAMPSRNLAIDIYYEFSHEGSRLTSDLYELAQESTQSEDRRPKILPTYKELLYTFSPSLSYDDRQQTDLHTISPNIQWRKGVFAMLIKSDICLERQHIDYLREGNRYLMSRTSLHPGNMELQIKFPLGKSGLYRSQFSYYVIPKSPDLINMIDITDKRDPMNILIGNPDLKNSVTHRIGWIVNGRNSRGNLQMGYSLNSNIYGNMLSAGYDYNTTTGVKTSWLRNINGNWDIRTGQSLHIEFKKLRGFFFENKTGLYYTHSVDFLGINGAEISENKVNTFGIGEELKFGYNKSGYRAEIFFKGDMQNYSSKMEGFKNFTAGDFNYGLRGIVKLIANFQLSTDFTIYSRRGYTDRQLNTNNFVWNARLSYVIPKTGLTFMADGFDILHDLSNISYKINAQARTESYYTVLPNYFLFHVQWTFNRKPKH